ncbi:MAG: outer membrane protein assembly factor BamB family protein [Phycisphaerales bacterium]
MPAPRRTNHRSPTHTLIACLIAGAALATPAPARAQATNPVYVDDSPAAGDALLRAGELARVGNRREAAEVLMRLLQESAEQVVPITETAISDPIPQDIAPQQPQDPEMDPGQDPPPAPPPAQQPDPGFDEPLGIAGPTLHRSVRTATHELLLSDESLLSAYRAAANPIAARLLDAGNDEIVEQAFLLTPAGFDAAIGLASEHIANAEFFAACHTLAQLDRHPDRIGPTNAERRARAARILAQATRYAAGFAAAHPALPDDERDAILAPHTQLRDRWLAEAGLDPTPLIQSPEWPPMRPARSPLEPGEPAQLAGMLPRPLATVRLSEATPDLANVMSFTPQSDPRANTQILYTLPTVEGDRVYLNTGDEITCWDRFTLTKRWSVGIASPDNQFGRAQGFVDDPNEVVLAGRRAITITGIGLTTPGRSFQSDRMLIALGRDDGRILWSRRADELVAQGLSDFEYAGVPVVSENTVVVMLERLASQQREQAVAAAGFDITDGTVRWVRQLGSTGTTSFVQATDRGGQPLARGGIVHFVTPVGVIAGIQAHNGRVAWVRTEPSSLRIARMPQPAWATPKPSITPSGLLTLSPDRTRLLLIDPLDGRLKAARSTTPLGAPLYLLRSPGRILAISNAAVLVIEESELFTANARELFRSRDSAFRGRASLAGDRVLVPTADGVVVIGWTDPQQAERSIERIELEATGTPIASDGHLIVVTDASIHSFLLWDRAVALLTERLDRDPDDPIPAIVLVELAYFAGRAQTILDATGIASERLARITDELDAEAARARLFAALLEVVEPRSTPPPGSASLTIPERDRIVSRIDELARTPRERVSANLAGATLYELTARPAEAIARYQAILDDPELAESQTRSGSTAIPAGTLATQRLRKLAMLFGPDAYAPFDARARDALSAVPRGAPPERYESIARRYPLARATIEAWSKVAELALGDNREPLAIYSLEQALRTAMDLATTDDAPEVARVAGQLLAVLIELDRVTQARDVVARIAKEYPNMQIDVGVGPRSIDRVLEVLEQDQRTRRALPEIALPLSREPRQADATTLSTPTVQTEAWRTRSHAIVRTSNEQFDRFIPVRPGEPIAISRTRSGWPLRPNEAVVAANDQTVLTARHELMNHSNEHDLVITARDARTGEERWTAEGFRAALNPQLDAELELPGGPRSSRRTLPLHGSVELRDRVVLIDNMTLAIIERTGVGVGYDLSDGRILWATDRIMNVVHDAWMDAGIIALGGMSNSTDNDAGLSVGMIMALEARTGRTLSTHYPDDTVRWVRTLANARIAVGLHEGGVVAIDPFRGDAEWALQRAELAASVDAWAVPTGLLIRDSAGTLWLVTVGGEVSIAELDTGSLLERGFGEIEIRDSGRGFMIQTGYGVAWYDADGQPVGVAGDPQGGTTITVAESRDHVFIASTRRIAVPVGLDSQEFRYLSTLRVYESQTARLVDELSFNIPKPLEDIRILDGVALLSTGSVLFALDGNGAAEP